MIMLHFLKTHKGLSLIELIVTITILGILASGVMPLIRNTTIRSKEIELRRNLRIIRIALDDYKKTSDKYAGPLTTGNGYPEKLKDLVDGHQFQGVTPVELKFLRRPILNPLDPNSAKEDNWGWEPLCYSDKIGDTWCGNDVYDVYAPQDMTSMDGITKYNEW